MGLHRDILVFLPPPPPAYSPGFTGKTTLKEKWYGTEYNEFPLLKDTQIDRWTKCLRGESEWTDSVFLPLQNPFVPTDFTIITSGLSAVVAVDNSATAQAETETEGTSDSVMSPIEAKVMPGLIDYVTTVSVDTDTAEDESPTELAGDVSSSSTVDAVESTGPAGTTDTSAAIDLAPAAGAADASDDAEEDDEEGEGEGEEGPAGQLPPPQGKVRLSVCCYRSQ